MKRPTRTPRQSPVWAKAFKSCADPHRAKHHFEELAATDAAAALQAAPAEQARALTALFSGSPALSEVLIAHPDWLTAALNLERLKHPRHEQGVRREVSGWLKPLLEARDYGTALKRLREFKQREMLCIAARDLARFGNAPEITRELSDLADACLEAVWKLCCQQFIERFGLPYHQDAMARWQPTAFCVLGMGKLGGQELNYSSDVDLLFVYSDEGFVFKEPPGRAGKPPAHALSSHQFYNRLGQAFIEEVTRMAPEGTLHRIDMRLRPEGDAGPLARSLPGYENYYAQWGQTWERMMLIKARCVAGDRELAGEFLETIQAFRYPRSLSEGVLREIAAMKDRIENEVIKSGELDRNVKLGRGGIREIEFVAQTMQILNAGKQPFLQDPQTLSALDKLVKYHVLPREEALALAEAYCFLRDVEHRLQMERSLQTHTIPAERKAQERLAKLMGFAGLKKFEAARLKHTRSVRRVYDKLLKAEAPEAHPALPPAFEGAEAEWRKLLAEHAFRDPEKAFRLFQEFAEGPGYVHVSPRTVELAQQLIPHFLSLCPGGAAVGGAESAARRKTRAAGRDSLKRKAVIAEGKTRVANRELRILSDPDRVLTRLDSFITAYGARAMLFEAWNSNRSVFELLLWLFDRSEFLAEVAIRTPDLIDELIATGQLRRSKAGKEIFEELRHGLKDADQHRWIRRYHQAEVMRIGLRDMLGFCDIEQTCAEISTLADACLGYALEVVMRRHKLNAPPFIIVGLGKLGGGELTYGSDLDVVFIAADKVRNLPKLQHLAIEIMDLLSARTEAGLAFHTDARLRPDGEKGLLVNLLKAYDDYYRLRAQLWEIQAISRTRPIAGDMKLGTEFQQLARKLTNFKEPAHALGAYMPDWKQKVHQMRMRIEKERTPVGKDDLAIKTGKGGLMDGEFIAQTLCLENGWQEANTLRALQRARETKRLARPDADELIENYRQLHRVEHILRRWSVEGETVLPDDPAPFYRVSVRCGFATPEAFRDAVAGWREAIRKCYWEIFASE